MKAILLVGSVFSIISVFAAPRIVSDFNTGWTADGEPVTLPHTWNAEDGADGTPEGARGEKYVAWKVNPASATQSYARKAVRYKNSLPDPKPGRRYFFRCKGASVTAEVYVNNILIGRHLGAYSAFCYEITGQLKPTGNKIAVYVDNRHNRDIPTLSADFTIFGGMYRGCEIIETDEVCIDPTYYGGSGVELKIDSEKGIVKADVHVLGGEDETREFRFDDFELWSPENPKLYSIDIELKNGDKVTETFGFRKAEFDKEGNFRLNGQIRRLNGVNRHQDRKGKGWAISAADEEEDVKLIKEMGADAVRTAHYPQSENLYDLLDRNGLIAWCEVPVTDTLSPSPAYRATLEEMCREMVVQLGHHPSICMWSIFNEIQNGWSPKIPDEKVVELLKMEKAIIREVDGEKRPIVAADCMYDNTAIGAVPDALAINAYAGWYWKTADMMTNLINRTIRFNKQFRKIGMSEYGAGGNPAHHEWPSKQVKAGGPFHPIENQLVQHIGQYRMMYDNERIWGTYIWNMFDFAADTRDEGSTPGMNDKGLVTYDRQTKKDVYYFYQANWTDTPVLLLAGKNVTTVKERVVPVLAISNLGPVTLIVNGKEKGTQSPDELKCVRFEAIALEKGRNTIEVLSGGRKESAVWELK